MGAGEFDVGRRIQDSVGASSVRWRAEPNPSSSVVAGVGASSTGASSPKRTSSGIVCRSGAGEGPPMIDFSAPAMLLTGEVDGLGAGFAASGGGAGLSRGFGGGVDLLASSQRSPIPTPERVAEDAVTFFLWMVR